MTRSRFGLREPVGARQPNRPDDLTTVERLLNRVGQPPFDGDREPTGFFSVPLRDSIRSFQRRSDVRDDGIVNPDGETLEALRREIGFDDEDAVGRAVDTTDTDGNTQLGLRCRRIAVDLENHTLRFENLERQVEEDRRALEQALERVREAATAKARQPAEIVAAGGHLFVTRLGESAPGGGRGRCPCRSARQYRDQPERRVASVEPSCRRLA